MYVQFMPLPPLSVMNSTHLIKKLKNLPFCNYFSSPKVRQRKFKKQRKERGFDDSELWSLDVTIARFIAPRLEAFLENAGDIIEMDDEFVEDVKFCIKIFKEIAGEKVMVPTEEQQIGLEKFAKIYFKLWD